jgi:hypothetical protein
MSSDRRLAVAGLNHVFAIEIRATKKIGPGDLRGLKSFAAFYGKPHTPLVVCMGENPARMDGVEILPVEMALAMLAHG